MKIAREVKLALVSFAATCTILVSVDRAAANDRNEPSVMVATPFTAAANV